jgi:hypothetical protein
MGRINKASRVVVTNPPMMTAAKGGTFQRGMLAVAEGGVSSPAPPGIEPLRHGFLLASR